MNELQDAEFRLTGEITTLTIAYSSQIMSIDSESSCAHTLCLGGVLISPRSQETQLKLSNSVTFSLSL